jgi:hypothetical protein
MESLLLLVWIAPMAMTVIAAQQKGYPAASVGCDGAVTIRPIQGGVFW